MSDDTSRDDDAPNADKPSADKPSAAKPDAAKPDAETSGADPAAEAAARAAAAGHAQEADDGQPPYKIVAQYIKDLSVENPQAPEIFSRPASRRIRPQVSIDVTTRALGARLVEVVVHTEVKGALPDEESGDGRPAYLIELAYGCAVEVGPIDKRTIEPLLMIEIPRILYPYFRAILSESSRDAGFSIVMLPPIDFLAMYRTKKAQGALQSVDVEQVAQERAAQSEG
ncbi:MAG: protein-export chaperone SecB [Marivibrio sp.]|uniref:protein-export chaperone SecB n=1 Tax=Marivibrio sp. TaxID=2039719 RepID=UPI0032ED0FB9